MGWKKFTNFLKKVVKPVAAIAAIVYPPLIPMIGGALGATGATASIVGAAALSSGASLASGDSLKEALTTGAISGLTAGLVNAAAPSVFEGGLLSGADGIAAADGVGASGFGSTGNIGVVAPPTVDTGLLGGSITPSITTTPTDLGIDYSLSNARVTGPLTDMGGAGGIQAGTSANLGDLGGGQGLTLNVGAPVTTVADAINAISGVNPANLASMGGGQGLTLQTPTGLVTEGGTLNVGGLTGNNSVIGQTGIDTATNIGSGIGSDLAKINTGVDDIKLPTTAEPTTPKLPLSASDAIRLAGIVATVAGAGKLASSGTGGGGFDIVPIPADWTSPPPTSTAAFTPLPEIDFGNKEMLRGTQWERLLSPDYGKAPAPTQYAQPNNMSYDELTRILGGSRTSVPTQSLTINDVISGIQNQYGQAPKGAVG